ncbi:MAG: hypothetical protein OXE53_07290 [Deltaproteobacteria bacterium]|nr:hypothetical protein [Deltaproteobacteria bacterium]
MFWFSLARVVKGRPRHEAAGASLAEDGLMVLSRRLLIALIHDKRSMAVLRRVFQLRRWEVLSA